MSLPALRIRSKVHQVVIVSRQFEGAKIQRCLTKEAR